MKRLSIICIILCFSALSMAQNPLKEIQRTILFDTTQQNYDNYFKASMMFVDAGDYNRALMCINSAYTLANSELSRSEILIRKADIYIYMEQYFNAISALLPIENMVEGEIAQKVNYRLGACYFCLKDYDKSYKYFVQVIPVDNEKKFQKVFEKTIKHGSPSPIMCGIASALIPGTGQYISRSVVDGLSSEMLLTSLALAAVGIAHNYGNWTAILCVLPWFQRYYFGGIKNATDCAKKREKAKIAKIVAAVKRCV